MPEVQTDAVVLGVLDALAVVVELALMLAVEVCVTLGVTVPVEVLLVLVVRVGVRLPQPVAESVGEREADTQALPVKDATALTLAAPDAEAAVDVDTERVGVEEWLEESVEEVETVAEKEVAELCEGLTDTLAVAVEETDKEEHEEALTVLLVLLLLLGLEEGVLVTEGDKDAEGDLVPCAEAVVKAEEVEERVVVEQADGEGVALGHMVAVLQPLGAAVAVEEALLQVLGVMVGVLDTEKEVVEEGEADTQAVAVSVALEEPVEEGHMLAVSVPERLCVRDTVVEVELHAEAVAVIVEVRVSPPRAAPPLGVREGEVDPEAVDVPEADGLAAPVVVMEGEEVTLLDAVVPMLRLPLAVPDSDTLVVRVTLGDTDTLKVVEVVVVREAEALTEEVVVEDPVRDVLLDTLGEALRLAREDVVALTLVLAEGQRVAVREFSAVVLTVSVLVGLIDALEVLQGVTLGEAEGHMVGVEEMVEVRVTAAGVAVDARSSEEEGLPEELLAPLTVPCSRLFALPELLSVGVEELLPHRDAVTLTVRLMLGLGVAVAQRQEVEVTLGQVVVEKERVEVGLTEEQGVAVLEVEAVGQCEGVVEELEERDGLVEAEGDADTEKVTVPHMLGEPVPQELEESEGVALTELLCDTVGVTDMEGLRDTDTHTVEDWDGAAVTVMPLLVVEAVDVGDCVRLRVIVRLRVLVAQSVALRLLVGEALGEVLLEGVALLRPEREVLGVEEVEAVVVAEAVAHTERLPESVGAAEGVGVPVLLGHSVEETDWVGDSEGVRVPEDEALALALELKMELVAQAVGVEDVVPLGHCVGDTVPVRETVGEELAQRDWLLVALGQRDTVEVAEMHIVGEMVMQPVEVMVALAVALLVMHAVLLAQSVVVRVPVGDPERVMEGVEEREGEWEAEGQWLALMVAEVEPL